MSVYSTLILASHPQAYYRLDESSGTIAHDISGNGYNATASGATLNWPGAIIGDTDTSMFFSAGGGLALPYTLNPTMWSAITLEFWVNMGAGWNYVAVTNDYTGTLLYLNGNVASSGSGASIFISSLFDYAGSFTVSGNLDEVALYKQNLSATEAKVHYLAGKGILYKPRAFGGPALYTFASAPVTNTLNVPADAVGIGEIVALLNSSSLAAENVSVGDGTGVVGTLVLAENVLLADMDMETLSTGIAPESVSLADAVSLVDQLSTNDTAQPGENTPILLGSMQGTDSAAITDGIFQAGTLFLTSESVLIGELTLLSGVPMPSENVLVAELSTLQGGSSITSENVSLGDGSFLTGQPSPSDSAGAADVASLMGSTTFASESVSPNDSNSQAGQPLPVESVSLTDVNALAGSTHLASESVQAGDGSQLTSQSQIIDIVSLTENYSLLGSTQNVESLSLSELLNLLGLTTLAADSVVFGETVFYFNAAVFIAPPEGVSLFEQYTILGLTQNTDSAQLTEQYSLLGSTQLASEQVSLSELLSQSGAISLTDLVQLLEQMSLKGSIQSTENVPITDSTSLQGGMQGTENIALSEVLSLFGSVQIVNSAQLSDLISLLGLVSSSDSVSLSELAPLITSGGSVIFIAPPDSVALSESLSLVGNTSTADDVLLSDLIRVEIYPGVNVIVYARGGNVTLYGR